MDDLTLGGVLVAGGLTTFMALLFKVYVRVDTGRETLLDRYKADIASRDAVISAQQKAHDAQQGEIVALRIALDECRRAKGLPDEPG